MLTTHKIIFFTCIMVLFTIPLDSYGIEDPSAMEGDIQVVEKNGEKINLNLKFQTENGQIKSLGELFISQRPLLIIPVYYKCPGLCSLILNSFVENYKEVSLKMGLDYAVLTISFNPEDSAELALQKAKNYFKMHDIHKAERHGWRFLVGIDGSEAALMQQIGFKYKKDGEEFAHSAAIVVITPEGEISRYLPGINPEAKDMELALIDAGKGAIGSFSKRAFLYCFRFDPTKGRYTLSVMNASKVLGIGTVLTLGVILVLLRVKERRSKTS